MAASATVTIDPRSAPNGKRITRIVIDWVSAADGSCTKALDAIYGYLVKMVTDPGSTAPTDNYDITLIDQDGADALAGAGADRDTANTEQVYPVASGAQVPVFLCGTHTFTIAAAGDSKVGKTVLYIMEP